MSASRPKRWLSRTLKLLNWTLVFPTVLICVLLFVLLYTPIGLKSAIAVTERFVSGVSVEESSGSLLGGNTLTNIHVERDNLTLDLKTLSFSVNNRCFFTLNVCIDSLILDGLALDIGAINQTNNPPLSQVAKNAKPSLLDNANSASLNLFWLPFFIDVTTVQINQANIKALGHHINWQQFNVSSRIWGNRLHIKEPRWQNVNVALAKSDNTKANTPFTYTPLALSDLNLPLLIFVEDFRLQQFNLLQDSPITLNELAFSLQLQSDLINLTELNVSHEFATLFASAKVTPKGNYPIKSDISVTISHPELASQQLDLTLDGNLENLTLEVKARKQLVADLTIWANLLSSSLPLSIDLQAQKLAWPIKEPATVEISKLNAKAEGTFDALRFNTAAVIQGSDIPKLNLQANGEASLTSLLLEKLTITTLGGEISSQINANWQDNVTLNGVLTLNHIQPHLFWPTLKGDISGFSQFNGQVKNNGAWQIALETLDINGLVENKNLNLTGSFNAQDSSGKGDYRIHVPALALKHAQNTIALQGSLNSIWQMSLDMDITDLSQTFSPAKGQINANIAITGETNTPIINGKFDAKNLKWNELSLNSLALVSDININQNKVFSANVSLLAKEGKYQHHELDALTLGFIGNEAKHELTLDIKSQEHNANLTLQGVLSPKKHWQGTLSNTALSSLLGTWQLEKSTDITYLFSDSSLNITPHCWVQEESSLCLNSPLHASANTAFADIHLNKFNFESLKNLLPEQMAVSGLMDAKIKANWSSGKSPDLSLNIIGSDGGLTYKINEHITFNWQHWQLNALLKNDKLDSSLNWRINERSSVNLNAAINDVLSDTPHIESQLDISQFSLAFLEPLLAKGSLLTGVINSNLALSGNIGAPYLNGALALNQFTLSGRQAPLDVTKSDITLQFNGQEASLNGLLNTTSGEINLLGHAGFANLNDWLVSLSVKGDALRLQVPQALLHVAPDVTILATPTLTELSGNITIPYARINVDSLPQSAVGLSKDLIILDKNLEPIHTQEQNPFSLKTDLTIALGPRVSLAAFGLETQLKGLLRVRQNPQEALTVHGDVNLVDGTFRSFGQDLIVRKGRLSFTGLPSQPYLDVEAIRNPNNVEDGVTVGVRVIGPADTPDVKIFSEPAKGQANALSYLLTGRDLDSESGGSANSAITTALIGMSISRSGSLVGEIGSAFGVRDLTLDTQGSGDNSQVTVSGYLSRDLQIKYGYGIFNAIGEFTLRYRLMRNLYLEAVSGLDNAVDLLYKFEID